MVYVYRFLLALDFEGYCFRADPQVGSKALWKMELPMSCYFAMRCLLK